MPNETVRSVRVVLTDEDRSNALKKASEILKGLCAEITTKTLSERAARITHEGPGSMRAFMQRKLSNEERLALGINNSRSASAKRV